MLACVTDTDVEAFLFGRRVAERRVILRGRHPGLEAPFGPSERDDAAGRRAPIR